MGSSVLFLGRGGIVETQAIRAWGQAKPNRPSARSGTVGVKYTVIISSSGWNLNMPNGRRVYLAAIDRAFYETGSSLKELDTSPNNLLQKTSNCISMSNPMGQLLRGAIVNKTKILLVKMVKHIGFYVYQRSC